MHTQKKGKMDYIQLAGLIIVINLSFAIIDTTNIFTTSAENTLEDKISDNLIVQVLSGSETVEVGSIIWSGDKYLTAAIDLFVVFFQMTMHIPKMLGSAPFNWPTPIVTMVTTIQVIVYALGIAHFLRGIK